MRSVALLLCGLNLIFADSFKKTCGNVIGNVGVHLTLTCRFSEQCCIKLYKFKTVSNNDKTICKKDFSHSPCPQNTRFSCPYTAKNKITEFFFFMQTICGVKTTTFTVTVTGGDDWDNTALSAAPEVSLHQKGFSSPVTCNATCLYPKNITMTWKKNNKEHHEGVDIKPNSAYDDIVDIFLGCMVFVTIFAAIMGLIVWRKSRQVKRRDLSGTHTVQYFYTVVSGHIDLPEFTVVGMVDHQQFMYFDSDTMKAEPKTEWIRAEYWERETHFDIDRYHKFKNKMEMVKNMFNQSMSTDVHTLQMVSGCELDDDGTTRGFSEFGYDGEDFISFDKNTLTYTAANPQADIAKNKWQYCKAFLENACTNKLKKIVSYGKNVLERKDAPEVSLLQKDSSSPVICHATGFYPKNITMTWKKNNEDHNEDVEVSVTLPNADGTFQKSISLSVKSEEWKKNPDVYRCVIQHVGAEKDIVVTLNENNIRSNELHASDDITAISVGCVLALTVFTVIMGLIVWRKSREVKTPKLTGYARGSNTESNSDEKF